MLQDKIFRKQGSINSIRIFKSKELAKATDNFSEGQICGRGGFGTVYKGNLSDGTIVAIKKSKIVDQSQTEQFINEITVQSQINHRNVVRFLGCCLETPVPLLVYEFITNGTLSDHLHVNNNDTKMPWRTRLRIAAETAGVLAYLHSAHSTPIIHRDIKPTNILLDDDFTSKVSDFGASRLIPKNEDEMCTMVQGTLGYLDPEYFLTSQLNEKSDVYSFGVVLVELMTGLKAVSFDRQEQDWNLVNYFLSLMKEDRVLEIVDGGIANEEHIEEIMKVANVAKMCLMVKGEERPTMKEVAIELESLLMALKYKFSSFGSNGEHLKLAQASNNRFGSSVAMCEDSGTGKGDDLLALEIDGDR